MGHHEKSEDGQPSSAFPSTADIATGAPRSPLWPPSEKMMMGFDVSASKVAVRPGNATRSIHRRSVSSPSVEHLIPRGSINQASTKLPVNYHRPLSILAITLDGCNHLW